VTDTYNIAVTNLITLTSLREGENLYAHDSCKIKVSIAANNSSNYSENYRKIIRWNLGDGTIVRDVSAVHSYKYPGKYTISCTFYDIAGTPIENTATVDVIVKEPIPTQLEFLNPGSWKKNYPISKNNKLGTLFVTVSNLVSSEPEISVIRRWSKTKDEDSYFDIKNEHYYHLKKYYTFLEKQHTNAIDSSFNQSLLQPSESVKVSYIPIYGKYVKDGTSISLKSYYISRNTDDLLNERYNATRLNSIKNLPEDATLLGKVGYADIWYKNDNKSTNDLIFEFKNGTLKFKDEPISTEHYLNIPPLGITINTVSSSNNIIEALTSNGIFNTEYCNALSNTINLETHLKHNLYYNYTVEAYQSKFILNDSINNEVSYSLLKDEDLILNDLSQSDTNTGCKVEIVESSNYYKTYNITPTEVGPIKLVYKNEPYYTANSVIDLNSLVLPSEKKSNINIDELLDVYMDHPMYENATNLKTLFKDIFKNKDILSYITSKGVNIIDDSVNYKTCHLDKLLSILEMMDEKVKHYDIDSFDRINDLKEMIRIMTMNYSELFGNVLQNEYDIHITHSTKGKNVSDKLEPDDVVLVNEVREIIGIRRGSKIYPLITKTPYLIVKDDFTLETTLVNFAGIEPIGIEDCSDQDIAWIKKHPEFIGKVYSYKLEDYDETWGWVLNLPGEYKDKTRKTLIIDTYYSFYIFNPISSNIRKYNFLDESTIPVYNVTDENGNNIKRDISVEEWNALYGFTYDCLMKILTATLMLRNSN
jgi:hypothetical protein